MFSRFEEPERIFFGIAAFMAVSAGLHWYFIFANLENFQLNRPAIHLHSFQMLYCTASYFVLGFLCRKLSGAAQWLSLVSVAACEFLVFIGLKNGLWYGPIALCFTLGFGFALWSVVRQQGGARWLESVVILCGGAGGVLAGLALYLDNAQIYRWSVHLGIYGYLLFFIAAALHRYGITGRWAKLSVLWTVVFFLCKGVSFFSETLVLHQNDWLHLLTLGAFGATIALVLREAAREQNPFLLYRADLLGGILQGAMVMRVTFGFVPALVDYRYMAAAVWTGGFVLWGLTGIQKKI